MTSIPHMRHGSYWKKLRLFNKNRSRLFTTISSYTYPITLGSRSTTSLTSDPESDSIIQFVVIISSRDRTSILSDCIRLLKLHRLCMIWCRKSKNISPKINKYSDSFLSSHKAFLRDTVMCVFACTLEDPLRLLPRKRGGGRRVPGTSSVRFPPS